MKYLKLFENHNQNIKEGDLVVSRFYGRIGLAVSNSYYDSEWDDTLVDVCYRSQMCDISQEDLNDLSIALNIEYSDIESYVSIALQEGYIINIPDEWEEEFPDAHEKSVKNKKITDFNL